MSPRFPEYPVMLRKSNGERTLVHSPFDTNRSQILVSNDLYRTMIITVIAVRMVQMAVDEIIDMIAVRDRFVAAAWAMDVGSIVPGAAVVGCATVRVLVAHLNAVFIHMTGVRVVKMTIVEVIYVVAMPNRDVTALWSVRVIVVGMMRKIAGGHLEVLSVSQWCSPACATAFLTSWNTWSSAIE